MKAVATLNPDHAWRLVLVGAGLLGLALWSVYDGHYAWPKDNELLEAARPLLCSIKGTPEEWLERDEQSAVTPLEAVFQEATGGRPPRKLVSSLGSLRLAAHVSASDLELAKQRQAVRDLFESPLYGADKLRGQFIQALVVAALGVFTLGVVLRRWRLVFEADDDGLRGSGFGGAYGWSEVAEVDWSLWSSKDIITIRFKDGRKVKCDGWHFRGMLAVAEVIKEKFGE